MRHLIWIAMLAASTQIPVAYAQSGGTDDTRSGASTSVGAERNAAENCGTPDEPKACPPLPRKNLPYYRGDRDKVSREGH
jgi:hypothetical protein